MKIFARTLNGIKSGDIVEFIQPYQFIDVGTLGEVCEIRGNHAWVYPQIGQDDSGKATYSKKYVYVDFSKIKLVSSPEIDTVSLFDGLSGRYIDIQKDIIGRYNVIVSPNSCCNMRTHAHPSSRRVCKFHPTNSAQSTFELFHEIGHIETTKSNMRRCEEEYYATVWAIDKFKEYGLTVPDSIIQKYQTYIDRELGRGLRRNGFGYDVDMDLYKHL